MLPIVPPVARVVPAYSLVLSQIQPPPDTVRPSVSASAQQPEFPQRVHTIRATRTANLIPTAAAWISKSNEEQLAKAYAMLEHAANELLEAGLAVNLQTPKDSLQDLLSKEAAAWGTDCIFVGARGVHSDDQPWRAGTVSTALVTHAPCSVEIFRA